MNRGLTESQRLRYHHDGIVFPICVLSRPEAAEYRRACDELESHLGGKPRTIEVRQMHLHFPWAYRLATHSRILDTVESLLGPNLLIWATELFSKHPNDPTVQIGWHRDRTYMGLCAEHTTTAWVALADSTEANGCVRAVPGPNRRTIPTLEELRACFTAPRAELVDVTLRPGEMSLHDAEIPHGSVPNHSDQKRVGFVIRYITPEARPTQGRPPAVLARGRFDGDHFRIQGPPEEMPFELALVRMKESAARHLDAVLGNLRGAETAR
jgi:hypothetical protein